MKKFLLSLLFFSGLLPVYSLERPDDLDKIYKQAIDFWYNGQIKETISNLEYIVYNSTDETRVIKAGRDLVVLLNELNDSSMADAYVRKLQAYETARRDPYLEFHKAYANFSLNKYKNASDYFLNVLTLTSDEDLVYFSRFMRGMVEAELSGFDKAIEELISVYRKYPQLLSASTYVIGRLYQEMGKTSFAINFMKDTLKYDSRNFQALVDLAQLYSDAGYYLPSWQSYYTLKEFDWKNLYFKKRIEKIKKIMLKEPDRLLYWSRLAWPVHSEPLKNRSLRHPIKVALYSDVNKKPAVITDFHFVTNTPFAVYDSILGKVFSGKANMQYHFTYVKENRLFELRDNFNSKLYSTRNDFRIKLNDRNGVILIKNPVIPDNFYQVDRGDREVANEIKVYVSTEGMKLVNYTYVEHILPSVVSIIEGPKENIEYLKALAVVTRTMIHRYLKNPVSDVYDMCDNKNCVYFRGIQYESPLTVSACKLTEDRVLYAGKEIADDVVYSMNNGGINIEGIKDNTNKPLSFTPYSLFKWINSDFFKITPYSMPEDSTQISVINWVQFLDPYVIEERINDRFKVGKIKNIYVLKRTKFGIVESIKIEGTANDLEVEGVDKVSEVLSGGTLRSNFFIIMPVMKGKFPKYFMLRGIGTGNFKGMDLYAAHYRAKHMGYKYENILKHYFPKYTVEKLR